MTTPSSAPSRSLIVVASGGREQLYSNDELRQRLLHVTDGWHVRLLLHGGSRGGDRTIGRIAQDLGWPVDVIPADTARHGRQAGALRDQAMLELALRKAADLTAIREPTNVLVVAVPRPNGPAPLLRTARAIKAPPGILLSIHELQ